VRQVFFHGFSLKFEANIGNNQVLERGNSLKKRVKMFAGFRFQVLQVVGTKPVTCNL